MSGPDATNTSPPFGPDAFAIPTGIAYLNCAYMAPQLRAVTDAGLRAVERKQAPWTITPADFFDDLERLRELFSSLLGGDADGVAVVPAASYALTTVAANVTAGPGDRVVILADQYPSNVYPWRDLAQRTGAEIVAVAQPASGDWTDAVVAAVDDRTAVVAVPHCHFMSGALLDLNRVGAAARSAGALFVIDATQSLGALPLDVAELQADVVVAAGYKWLLGPYSVAYAWFAPQHREWRPLEHHWAGRRGSEDFARLTNYNDAFRPGARRFDGGEASNFALLPMSVAALSAVKEWGVDRIAAAISPLTDAIARRAADLGQSVDGPRAGHIIGLHLPAGSAERVAQRMAGDQVYVSVRGDNLRVSPHVYNTDADVDQLLAALEAAL